VSLVLEQVGHCILLYRICMNSLITVTVNKIVSGILLSGISSSLTSLNFLVVACNGKCYGMTLTNLFVYLWSIWITSFMLAVVNSVLLGCWSLLIADLHYNTVFFDIWFGGDPVFYQHLFWFFGHPEVYVLIIPAFGLINMVLSSLCKVVLFG